MHACCYAHIVIISNIEIIPYVFNYSVKDHCVYYQHEYSGMVVPRKMLLRAVIVGEMGGGWLLTSNLEHRDK